MSGYHHLGLTLEAEQFVSGMYYSGIHEFDLGNGNVAQLRTWRPHRYNVTCSIGGAIEVPQLYVGEDLYTALVDFGTLHGLEMLRGGDGTWSRVAPVFGWDRNRAVWRLLRKVPEDAMIGKWVADEFESNRWSAVERGKFPAELLKEDKLAKAWEALKDA